MSSDKATAKGSLLGAWLPKEHTTRVAEFIQRSNLRSKMADEETQAGSPPVVVPNSIEQSLRGHFERTERSGRRVGSSRSSGTIANSVATTRELSQRSEQLRVLLVHRTNIPPQFLSSAAEQSIAHGTPASATAVSVCPQAAPYGWRPAPLPAPPPASCGQARAQRACSMAPCCLCRDSRTAPRW